jgi:hypothetical protein
MRTDQHGEHLSVAQAYAIACVTVEQVNYETLSLLENEGDNFNAPNRPPQIGLPHVWNLEELAKGCSVATSQSIIIHYSVVRVYLAPPCPLDSKYSDVWGISIVKICYYSRATEY